MEQVPMEISPATQQKKTIMMKLASFQECFRDASDDEGKELPLVDCFSTKSWNILRHSIIARLSKYKTD